MPPEAFKRSEERFSRNAETDLVCRLLLEKKNRDHPRSAVPRDRRRQSFPVDPAEQALGGRRVCPVLHRVESAAGQDAPIRDRVVFFFNDTPPTEIYTLSLHDALPIFTHAYSIVIGSKHITLNATGGIQ